MKKAWYELTGYINKRQIFLLSIYFAFLAYFKNTTGEKKEISYSDQISYLKELPYLLDNIVDDTIRTAVMDFEKNIEWEVFANQLYLKKAIKLKESINYAIKTKEDLETAIELFEELVGELDNLMFTPNFINESISLFAQKYDVSTIGELFSGLGGTSIVLWNHLNKKSSIRFHTEELHKLYCDITKIRMFCHGMKNTKVLQKDIISSNNEKYELIIADLPKRNNETFYVQDSDEIFEKKEKIFMEWFYIQKIMQKLTNNGVAIIIVTKGALVRQKEEKIRRNITSLDWLEAVISLPPNLYTTSGLGFEILVLNKNKALKNKNNVFLADLSSYNIKDEKSFNILEKTIYNLINSFDKLDSHDARATIVSTTEILQNGCSWNPFLYLQHKNENNEEKKYIELEKIADISRGAQITKEEEDMLTQDGYYNWLNIRNIGKNELLLKDIVKINPKNETWDLKFSIQEDDIILTSKVTVLNACIVKPNPPKSFICSNLTRIRVDKRVYHPYVLYEFLCSKEGKDLLQSIQTGTTIKVLNNTNLKKLKVPLYKNVNEIGEQLKKIHLSYMKEKEDIENRYKKKKKNLKDQLI